MKKQNLLQHQVIKVDSKENNQKNEEITNENKEENIIKNKEENIVEAKKENEDQLNFYFSFFESEHSLAKYTGKKKKKKVKPEKIVNLVYLI